MEKQKQKEKKFLAINIVLYPQENQHTECYIDLFKSIKDKGDITIKEVDAKPNRVGLLNSFEEDTEGVYIGHYIVGDLIDSRSEGWNIDQATHRPLPIQGRNLLHDESIFFYFDSSIHRIFIPNIAKRRREEFEEFIKKATKLIDRNLELELIVIKDISNIRRVFTAPIVKSIDVEVCYTNNANNRAAGAMMDAYMREEDVHKMRVRAEADKGKSIGLIGDTNILGGLVDLSNEYGYTKAEIVNESGVEEKIDTRQHPRVYLINESKDNPLTAERIRRLSDDSGQE